MVGIVVVAYKSAQMTIDFVKREHHNIDIPFVMCIVNNEATDEDSQMIADGIGAEIVDNSFRASDCSNIFFVISSKENLGFAKGNNLGTNFLLANFKITHLLFSNNDIEIKSQNCISVLVNKLESDKRIGAIGPRVISLDGTYQWPHDRVISIYRQIGWIVLPFLRRKHKKEANDNPVPPSDFTYWVQGSFLLMSAEVFKQIGMFDPHTFLYAEEPILAEKLRLIGKHMYYESSVEVLHYEGGTIVKKHGSKKSEQMVMESNCYYYRKYLHNNAFLVWVYKTLFNLTK